MICRRSTSTSRSKTTRCTRAIRTASASASRRSTPSRCPGSSLCARRPQRQRPPLPHPTQRQGRRWPRRTRSSSKSHYTRTSTPTATSVSTFWAKGGRRYTLSCPSRCRFSQCWRATTRAVSFVGPAAYSPYRRLCLCHFFFFKLLISLLF